MKLYEPMHSEGGGNSTLLACFTLIVTFGSRCNNPVLSKIVFFLLTHAHYFVSKRIECNSSYELLSGGKQIDYQDVRHSLKL